MRPRNSGSQATRRWRKADSNSWSHLSARATLNPFATSRFEWDLCATYRSEPILPPIPSECAWRVVVVAVLRRPRRGFAGYAITGFFGAGPRRRWSNAIRGARRIGGLPLIHLRQSPVAALKRTSRDHRSETGIEHTVDMSDHLRAILSGAVSNNAAPTEAPSGSRTISRISRRDQDRDGLIIWP